MTGRPIKWLRLYAAALLYLGGRGLQTISRALVPKLNGDIEGDE